MAADPKPTRKKLRRRRLREADVFYVVAIEDWLWGYPAGYDDVPGFAVLQPSVEAAYCLERRIAGNTAGVTGA